MDDHHEFAMTLFFSDKRTKQKKHESLMCAFVFIFFFCLQVIDNRVQNVFLNYERRAEPLLQFQRQVQDLPKMVEQIQNITVAISEYSM